MNAVFETLFVILMFWNFLLVTDEMEGEKYNSYQTVKKLYSSNSSLNEGKILESTKKLVCFYVMEKNFLPEVLSKLCTHINVGFFRISEKNYSLAISNEQRKALSQVILLKEKNKDLKIILSIGGAGDTSFSIMVSNHTTRKMFIRSCISFIKKFKIDGLDLDWEWPVITNGNSKEKVKFIQLLHEIRKQFNRHKNTYILSVDVPSIQAVIELGYYVNYMADFVDYVNVMCYDYHYFTKLYPFTGHNAPLYSTSKDLFSKNINYSISFWISNSMPRSKILLGMPTYGHSFKLAFSDQHSLAAPAKGFGTIGQYGFASYQDICKFLKDKNTVIIFDEISKVPYAYQFSEWISYDDERSLAFKASYILKERLGGAMVFSVNADDYNGTCKKNGLPLPLIRKIRNILFNEVY